MKVAFLSRSVWGLHGYGGMERHVLELAHYISRAGVDVTLITQPPSRNLEWNEPQVQLQIVKSPRLPLRGIPDRVVNYPLWSHAAGDYLVEHAFDLVHAHGMAGWGYASMMGQGLAQAPLVISPYGMEEFKTSLSKRIAYLPFHWFARQAAQSASALIASDSSAVHEIPRFLNVPRERVILIPIGVDVNGARAYVDGEALRTVTSRYFLQQRAPLLLSVGRLEGYKGFDVLIDALARIRPSLPSRWSWLLVGDGPERARLAARIEALKLGAHAFLLGAVDEATLHNLFELATLFVHPTRFEGSSLVTLEAMAHARAIVATSVGGIPDKVLPGQNGYLVRPGNAVELGDKILYALRDPRRLREMGDASYELACRTFDWRIVIQATLALYQELTASPSRPLEGRMVETDLPLVSSNAEQDE